MDIEPVADEKVEPPGPEKPDVKAAAERVRSSRGEATRAGMDRARRAGKRIGRPPKRSRRAAPEPEDDEPETVEPPTPDEIAGAAALGGTVWAIAGPMFGCRALEEKEAAQLGAALAPVVKKYLPLLGEWQAEVNLLLVVYGLYSVTHTKAREAEAEVVESSPAPGAAPASATPRPTDNRMRVR